MTDKDSLYKEAIKKLQEAGYEDLKVGKKLSDGLIDYIEVHVPPISSENVMVELKEMLGEAFEYNWFPNGGYILITLKKL